MMAAIFLSLRSVSAICRARRGRALQIAEMLVGAPAPSSSTSTIHVRAIRLNSLRSVQVSGGAVGGYKNGVTTS